MLSDSKTAPSEQPKPHITTIVVILVLAFSAVASFIVYLAVGDFWSIFIFSISLLALASFSDEQLLWWDDGADEENSETRTSGGFNAR